MTRTSRRPTAEPTPKGAKAERVKGFQRVSVRFGDLARKATRVQTATARRRPAG